MSEMVERVARAIFNQTGGCADEMIAIKGALPKWIYDAARAAIEAMREPFNFMCVAAERQGDGDGYGLVDQHDAEEVWLRMIDAALKHQPSAEPQACDPRPCPLRSVRS